MKLLTISIAAYNVEPYLEKTLDSIVAANKNDEIEVFVVNDGSKDRTAEIARVYENRYPDTIHLVDKENGGHGSTINTGLQLATGKYFKALDGDDWFNSENLEKLVLKLDKTNADIILNDYCKCFENGNREIVEFEGLSKDKTYSFEEIVPIVEWMRYHTVTYRTELLKKTDVHLDEHCFYVDAEFMLLPIPEVETVFYAKDYLYCYRLGLTEQSVSTESRRKHIDNSETVAYRLLSFYDANRSKIMGQKRKYILTGVINHCIWHYKSLLLLNSSKGNKRRIKEFDNLMKQQYRDVYSEMGKLGRTSLLINAMRATKHMAYPIVSMYFRAKSN